MKKMVDGVLMDMDANEIAEHEAIAAQHAAMRPVAIREQRNSLLKETDWTQLPDVPKATRDAYKAYRQALRDVPAQEGFQDIIVWPELPGA